MARNPRCPGSVERMAFILLLLLSVPCSAASGLSPVAGRGLAVVDSLLGIGDYSAAAQRAEAMVWEFGDDPLYGWQLKGRLGLALVRAGQAAAAVTPLTEAIVAHPQDPVLHRNLAFALKVLGRSGRALAEYETVVQLVPTDPEARLEYGQTLLDFRDYQHAQQELELASRLCDQCLAADRALANLFLARGDPAGAEKYLTRVWQQAPSPQVRLLLATALASSGQGILALGLLDSLPASTLKPEEWRILIQVEKDNPEVGDHWSALAADVLGPERGTDFPLPNALLEDAKFWALIAANLNGAGHPDRALPALTQAIALDPGNVVYHRNRAATLLKLGRDPEARVEWDEVLRLDPRQRAHEGQSP